MAKPQGLLSPLERQTYESFGIAPREDRLSLLPRYSAKTGLIAPQFVYDAAKALAAPYTAAQGYDLPPEEAVNVGMNVMGGSFVGSAPKGALRSGISRDIKPVENKAFQNWFQESKVVDENKLPLTVYTGSKANIEQFSPQSDFAKISPTYWFSTNPKVASGYAMDPTRKGESLGAVYPAKLSLQNPLVIDAKNNNWDNITINNDKLKLKGFEAGKQKASTDYIAYIARQNGYDGLIIKNAKDNPVGVSGEISDVYTAFKPEQIKSVFNKGTFDPKDPRILYGGGLVGSTQLEMPEKKPKK
jgi:hypothetical protein